MLPESEKLKKAVAVSEDRRELEEVRERGEKAICF